MSQVTDPVLLDSTGQNIFTGILAVVSAIQSRGMPSPSASNPQMDGIASSGTSNDYARGDHVHPSDTSKASKADLTNIQATGTTNTTGAVIPAGAYFYLNGVLYRAKTQIGTNVPFTVNTNCEQVTEGSLNKIRSTDIPDEINSRFGYLRCVSKVNNTNSGVTLTFDLNGNGVGIMFVQAAGTEGAIYGLTVLDSVAATRLVGSYSPTMNGANPRSFSINVGPWANVTIICTRSGWTA